MSWQKDRGTKFETAAVDYGNARLGGNDLHRAVLSGSNDRGDVHGLKVGGKSVVIECKDRKRIDVRGWLDEAEDERGNADADFGVALFHLKGIGRKRFGMNAVVMTAATFGGLSRASKAHVRRRRVESGKGYDFHAWLSEPGAAEFKLRGSRELAVAMTYDTLLAIAAGGFDLLEVEP